MTFSRRKIIAFAGAAAALLVGPIRAFASRPEKAFASNSVSDVLNAQFGSSAFEPADIEIKAPDIAENGAVVPVTVLHNVEGAEAVSIIVENNPNPLAASFALTEQSGGLVSTRIKMSKSSPVHAVVKAGGKLYGTTKEVKVTIGGCGG